MRDVGDQAMLRFQQGFDLFRHVVEIAAQIRKFVFASGIVASYSRRKISRCQTMRRRAKVPNRGRDVTRQPKTDQPGNKKDRCPSQDLNSQRGPQNAGHRLELSFRSQKHSEFLLIPSFFWRHI